MHAKLTFVIKDKEARKDLGFSSSDTSKEKMSEEKLAEEYPEGDPIVSKKDYMT